MQKPEKVYPVIIVGAGITGMSTAFHLEEMGCSDYLILHDPDSPPTSSQIGAYAVGGAWDNFSRLVHSHGVENACNLWKFGNSAFDLLCSICSKLAVPLQRGLRKRLLVSKEELNEANLAVSLLSSNGFSQCVVEKRHDDLSKHVLGVQNDGNFAAYIDLASLSKSIKSRLQGQLLSGAACGFKESSSGVTILTKTHGAIRAEMVVLASHLGTRNLMNQLQDALVPVVDQWGHVGWQESTKETSIFPCGSFVSASHGYFWLTFAGEKGLTGGLRYLRKLAGVGAASPDYSILVERKLEETCASLLINPQVSSIGPGASTLEIIPCDEMPLIGPMFGCSRVLLGTGYMNLGLSYGTLAGKCLAQLITKGESDQLPANFLAGKITESLRKLGRKGLLDA